MNFDSVKSLFTLFSGETDCESFMPLINLAVSQTSSMLSSSADPCDPRLDFLSAAIANFRLAQINAARDRSLNTLNGKMLSVSASGDCVLKFAENLLMSYMQLCSALITYSDFAFLSCF